MPDIVELNSWFKLAEDNNTKWKLQAQEDLNYYLSKQWDAADIAILKEQKRPYLTFNQIAPRIHLVSGYQRQNRQDTKVHNKKGGTQEVADILTALIKHVNDNCNGDYESSVAFLSGIVMSKGYLDITVDYDDDPYDGEIRLSNLSPFQVYVDPFHERYDLSDAMYLFKTVWLPKKKIDMMYPEKKDEFSNLQVDNSDRMAMIVESSTYKPDALTDIAGMADIDKYKYRIKECWWREYETQTFLYNLNDGTAKSVDLSAAQVKLILAKIPYLRKIKRVVPKMHMSTYLGNVMLDDIIPYEDKGGLKRFPIIPFYPYCLEGNYFSMVTNLKDPQNEINKRYSQLLHHLNMSANSGYIGDADAVQDWDELEEMGTRPGVTIKKKKGSYLERIAPSQLSEGHLILAREGSNQLDAVSDVKPSLLGIIPEKQESGMLAQVRQKQGIIGLEPVFDNWRITQQLKGKVLIEYIQKSGAFSRDEMLKVVVDGEEKEFEINKRKKFFFIERIENDMTIGKYDVTVAQQPSNPTTRLTSFYSLLEAAKVGIPIPPETIVKASDLPNKEEILQGMAGSQQAQGEAAKQDAAMKGEELNLKKMELALKAKEIEIKGNIDLAKAEGNPD